MTFWNLIILMLIIVPLILLWVFTLYDITTRPDLSGLATVLWVVAVLFLPFIGTIVYFVVRPPTQDTPQPEPSALSQESSVDQLERLKSLHDSGALTDDEYDSMKSKVLG